MTELIERYKKIIIVGLAVVLLALAGAAFYFYRQFVDLKENPEKTAQEEISKMLEKVGRLMVLPENETPTIATVTDPERLKDQPFFANAKLGDKVIIYTNAKKAILYDAIANKILEVAPLNIGD